MKEMTDITNMPAGFLRVFESTGKTYRVKARGETIELTEE